MVTAHPRRRLRTHEVFNQPPPLVDFDPYEADPALQEGLVREGGAVHGDRVRAFAGRGASAEMIEAARLANVHVPVLRSFDRYGHRLDEVEYHPAYHTLMAYGLEGGVSAAAWTEPEAGQVLHTALLYLMSQVEASVCCPMVMTYASVPALSAAPGRSEIGGARFETWASKVKTARYDPAFAPMESKAGVTIGMAMTEKQGGSDVRSNTTRAQRDGDDGFRLFGHKWFCSAPMSDAFLTLAQRDEGLTCFLVPRWTPDGERNPFSILRLKDKLGDRANASSEVEYDGTFAWQVGEAGRGVRTIIEMVHHTRLDCAIAPAGFMRRTLNEALHHARHRSAFGRALFDQPLMRAVLADLAVESEAATALVFRLARAFDRGAAGDPSEHAFARIATPVAKYWLNKRVVPFLHEAMEVHGGAGYVEESPLPRFFRQAPVNGIWEGSGNVMCLDVLRAIARTPASLDVLLAELKAPASESSEYAAHLQQVEQVLHAAQDQPELHARRLVEALALGLQASLLLRSAPDPVASSFVQTRLDSRGPLTFGAAPQGLQIDAILDRHARIDDRLPAPS